jgi:hypothetical protein
VAGSLPSRARTIAAANRPAGPLKQETDGLDTAREQEIGQHIGYRYDVNLVPDYERLTPFLKQYLESWAGTISTGSRRPQHQRLGFRAREHEAA